jgi:hypothetical protein
VAFCPGSCACLCVKRWLTSLLLPVLVLLVLLAGPRGLSWRDDKPAELCWMEAQVHMGQQKGATSARFQTGTVVIC